MPHQIYDPAQDPGDQPEPDVHSRYATLGGAAVVMTAHDDTIVGPGYYDWVCTGCQESHGVAQREHACRREANKHAGQCRSMPPGGAS